MKVISVPYTVFADKSCDELAILSDGFRVIMTGDEAGALCAEIATALKHLWTVEPERIPSPPPVAAAAAVPEEQSATTSTLWAGNTGLEAVIDYARRAQSPDAQVPLGSRAVTTRSS